MNSQQSAFIEIPTAQWDQGREILEAGVTTNSSLTRGSLVLHNILN